VYEKVIAGLLSKDLESLTSELKMLHSRGIIEYIPQKDSPQLYISRARVKTEDLQIKEADYKKRKEQYIKGIY
jgi:ATP-dependent DNA helicase RecQ